MFEQGSLYRRKISRNIPICEWYQAEDFKKNDFGIAVYKAANTYLQKGVIAGNYYWVDELSNHIPFLENEITIGNGMPSDPAGLNGPYVYLDLSSGAIYTWETTTNTWVIVSGGSLNIYNSNGTLTGNRILDGGSNTLTFINVPKFSTSGIFELSDVPAVNNSATDILVRNTLTGEVEVRQDTSLISNNFATADLTLTNNRIHNLLGYSMELTANTTGSYFRIAIDDILLKSVVRTTVWNVFTLETIPAPNVTATKVLVRDVSGDVQEYDMSSIGGGNLVIQDEGAAVNLGGDLTKIDFVGDLAKASFSVDTATIKLPNIGSNLQMTGLNPSNSLNVVIGDLVTNHVDYTSTGKIIDVNIVGFSDTWNPSTGTGKATVILFKGASPTIWTSLLGGSEGKWIKIINLSNTILLLENDSTSGTPSARFINSNGRATPILANQSIDLVYTSGMWYMSNLPTYDIWDDFIGVPTGIGGGNWLTSTHSLGVSAGGNWGVGINGTRFGSISAEAGSAARAWIGESTTSKSNPNMVGIMYFDRFNTATTPVVTQRYSRGINRAQANATSWVSASSGAIDGASLVFYPDSGLPNATTNWFYYVGTGTLADYTSSAVDSGITVVSTFNNPQNLIVYYNSTNFDVTYITSENNRDYTIRTTINRGVPLNSNTASLIHNRVSGSGGIPGLDWLCIHNPIKTYR